MPPRVIDCNYLDLPEVAAAYLVSDSGRAAFVDNNTTHAVPRLLAALADEGLRPDDVEYLIVTHVHLDHAGGTSALARACPDATVLCHPRAARHLVDPSKLVASARVVYGDETFEKLYGRIDPIDTARVRTLDDGAAVMLGARTLRFLHTRGHANHHFCVLDEHDASIYTGDAFGLAYPMLQGAGLFIFPSTSPTDFDPDEARRSVRRIVESGARRALPTHFGEVANLDEAAAQLLARLDESAAVFDAAVKSDRAGSDLEHFCRERLEPMFERAAAQRGLVLSAAQRDFLRLDLDLNAQGIAFVAERRRGATRA